MGNRRHCNDNSDDIKISSQDNTIDANLTADVADFKDPMDNTYDSVCDCYEDSECSALLGDNGKCSLNTTNRHRSVSCSAERRETPDAV